MKQRAGRCQCDWRPFCESSEMPSSESECHRLVILITSQLSGAASTGTSASRVNLLLICLGLQRSVQLLVCTHTQLIGTFSSSVMKHIGHVTGNGPALGHFVSGPLFFFSWHKTKEKVKKSATPAVSRLQIQQAAPRTRRAEQTCPSAQSIGGNLFFWFRSIC